jgi:8-oxo-dGTP diphosphatase
MIEWRIKYVRVQVGVAVIIKRRNKVLMGLRKGSHGARTWSFPGGHIEFGKTIVETACREVMKETGLDIIVKEYGPYTEDFFMRKNKHHITLYVVASPISDDKPKVLEPEKRGRWAWFDWDELPQPLFPPVRNLLAEGFDPR